MRVFAASLRRLCLLACLAVANGAVITIPLPWGIQMRGGSTMADEPGISAEVDREAKLFLREYSSVSIVVMGDSDRASRIQPGCMLLAKDLMDHTLLWTGRGLWTENSEPLIESLSLMSDVVVLVLESTDPLDSNLIQRLRNGFQRRVDAGLSKAQLLVVLAAPISGDEGLYEWEERLVAEDFASLKTEIVDLMDFVTQMPFEETLDEIIDQSSAEGIAKLVPAAAFPILIKQVYQSLGGGESVLLEEQHESLLSDIDDISKPSIETCVETGAAEHEIDVDIEAALLGSFYHELDDLQSLQEEVWLDPGGMPMDFGNKANPILEELSKRLEKMPDSAQKAIQEKVGSRLQDLYQQHLQSLRDYYGKMYEALLDDSLDDPTSWNDKAAKVTASFRNAAQDAVPKLCREGGAFRDMDLEYATCLQGLLSDMMEATEAREVPVEEDLDDVDVEEVSKPKRPAKWYEKIAARALVLGVNYLQGWLAWQGIKRAAMERERNMPKFPLF